MKKSVGNIESFKYYSNFGIQQVSVETYLGNYCGENILYDEDGDILEVSNFSKCEDVVRDSNIVKKGNWIVFNKQDTVLFLYFSNDNVDTLINKIGNYKFKILQI